MGTGNTICVHGIALVTVGNYFYQFGICVGKCTCIMRIQKC